MSRAAKVWPADFSQNSFKALFYEIAPHLQYQGIRLFMSVEIRSDAELHDRLETFLRLRKKFSTGRRQQKGLSQNSGKTILNSVSN